MNFKEMLIKKSKEGISKSVTTFRQNSTSEYAVGSSLCYDIPIRNWIRICKGEEDYDTRRKETH